MCGNLGKTEFQPEEAASVTAQKQEHTFYACRKAKGQLWDL